VSEALDRLSALLDEEVEEVRRRNLELRKDKDDHHLEKSGLLLRRAQVGERRPTLYTRERIRFEDDPSRRGQIDEFDVRPGSVVHVRARGSDNSTSLGARGVVVFRRPGRLEVVFEESPEFGKHGADLLRIDDEVTLRRLRDGVEACRKLSGRALDLLCVLLGHQAPRPARPGTFEALDSALNEAQVEAAKVALFAEDLALVHGPPGTGKTRVVVEVIRQCVARGERVLCLCASNAAVDHVALSALTHDPSLSLARAGHPARAHADLVDHTLAGLTDQHELRKISRQLFDEAHQLLRGARRRSDRGRDAYKREREAKVEAGRLFADARRMERQAVQEVMRRTRVLCGTLTGYARELPEDEGFDVLVVDEASQALTPALLLGIARAKRVVLAGDHKQLPPTVISPRAEAEGLGRTAFDEAMAREDADTFARMLVVQHRMNEALMRFPSSRFYDEKLEAHPSVAAHTLADLEVTGVELLDDERVLEVIDTAGAGFEEGAVEDSDSRDNEGEARVVEAAVRALRAAGLDAGDIGVITPYAAQAARLSHALHEEITAGLEVDSVDGFQGREKEAIVLSLVRSNPLGEIGFVKDARRLNVSITRAKRKLVVVGDSATLSTNEVLRAFYDAAIAAGGYRSVFETGLV
jgi:superfamily I DNA and/or RNA helicase